MDRAVLLEHIRRTRFAPGDRQTALNDAARIADYLRAQGARRVIGIGSAFEEGRHFGSHSDVDLVVEGLPAVRYFAASAGAEALTRFPIDVIPLESAASLIVEIALQRGVEL